MTAYIPQSCYAQPRRSRTALTARLITAQLAITAAIHIATKCAAGWGMFQ